MFCKYCGKVIKGKPYTRAGNFFHDAQESILYEHAETFVIPPYPKENPFPTPHSMTQPFDKEEL